MRFITETSAGHRYTIHHISTTWNAHRGWDDGRDGDIKVLNTQEGGGLQMATGEKDDSKWVTGFWSAVIVSAQLALVVWASVTDVGQAAASLFTGEARRCDDDDDDDVRVCVDGEGGGGRIVSPRLFYVVCTTSADLFLLSIHLRLSWHQMPAIVWTKDPKWVIGTQVEFKVIKLYFITLKFLAWPTKVMMNNSCWTNYIFLLTFEGLRGWIISSLAPGAKLIWWIWERIYVFIMFSSKQCCPYTLKQMIV